MKERHIEKKVTYYDIPTNIPLSLLYKSTEPNKNFHELFYVNTF